MPQKIMKASHIETSNLIITPHQNIGFNKGASIKYVRKIFQKANISNPLVRRGLEMLVFREILHTYLMDDP